MQLINPDINIDFLKAARPARLLSIVLILGSLLLLAVRGLNMGIDFKGGTKIIAAFTGAHEDSDRDKVRDVIRNLAQDQLGTSDVQVEVQDFFSGGVGDADIHRFQILTELTSFLGEERREALTASLKEAFAGNLENLQVVREGEDKFYIFLKERQEVPATVAKIRGVFEAAKLADVQISSAAERQMDIDFYRELNLQIKEGADPLTVQQRMEEHAAHKAERLASMTDLEFEVRVEELKGYLEAAFQKNFQGTFKEVESFTSISSSVGADLLNSGILSLLYAIIGVLIYIWVRFDMRYSPGAVVAVIHDVIVTVGFFAAFQVKFTLPIIAALLTIIGYSLNDTIVIYDRIRENLDRVRQRSITETVNRSVNETLSRTLLTTMTTLFVVLCLLFLGGGQIVDFALALTVGMVSGTYSTVYVASPMVVFLDGVMESRKADQRNLGKDATPAQRSA